MKPELQISKLDAARRQLESAVRLYFKEGDPVSIHTLTAAAYQLLSDISAQRGGTLMLKDLVTQWVRPDAVDEARRRLNEAQNFFKHADRDADEILAFKPAQTELLLLDGCHKYRELTGEVVPVLAVYQSWFWLTTGADLVRNSERARIPEELREAFPGATRQSFFAEALPLASDLTLVGDSDV